MAVITALQAQVTALQNTAPAATAAPPAGAAPVVFADTPQTLGTNDLINYLTKRGSVIFEHGCKALEDKALTDGIAMTPTKPSSLSRLSTIAPLRWAGSRAWGRSSAGRQVDMIKSYDQINKATLKTACKRFCKPGQPDAQTCAKQNSMMVSICLAKLLTADAQARLLTYSTKYVVSCKHSTQDVCTVNKVRKNHSMCEMVESVQTAIETQKRVFC